MGAIEKRRFIYFAAFLLFLIILRHISHIPPSRRFLLFRPFPLIFPPKYALSVRLAPNVVPEEASSRTAAQAVASNYRIAITVDDTVVADGHRQTAVLAAVALGRRVFLGSLTVAGNLNVLLVTPLPFGRTLADAVAALGGTHGDPPEGIPVLRVGNYPGDHMPGFCVRLVFAGCAAALCRTTPTALPARQAGPWRSRRCSPRPFGRQRSVSVPLRRNAFRRHA